METQSHTFWLLRWTRPNCWMALSACHCQLCSYIESNNFMFSILNANEFGLCSGFFSTQCMLPPRRFHLGGFLWSMRSSSSMHPSAQRSRGGRPRVRDRMLRRWCETFQNSYTKKDVLIPHSFLSIGIWQCLFRSTLSTSSLQLVIPNFPPVLGVFSSLPPVVSLKPLAAL